MHLKIVIPDSVQVCMKQLEFAGTAFCFANCPNLKRQMKHVEKECRKHDDGLVCVLNTRKLFRETYILVSSQTTHICKAFLFMRTSYSILQLDHVYEIAEF